MIESISQKVAEVTASYYDELLRYALFRGTSHIKWRKRRVPRYLKLKVPVIENHVCYDEAYEESEKGLLIKWKEIATKIKIGTEVISIPVYPRGKFKTGQTITFKRYKPLKV